MCKLFGNVTQFVGKKLGWEYNEKEEKAAKAFLEYVHQLSKNTRDSEELILAVEKYDRSV